MHSQQSAGNHIHDFVGVSFAKQAEQPRSAFEQSEVSEELARLGESLQKLSSLRQELSRRLDPVKRAMSESASGKPEVKPSLGSTVARCIEAWREHAEREAAALREEINALCI